MAFAAISGGGSCSISSNSAAFQGFSTVRQISPALHILECQLSFENENKVYRAGEVIYGSYCLASEAGNAGEINDLRMELEGELCLKNTTKDVQDVSEEEGSQKKYFFGKGWPVGHFVEKGQGYFSQAIMQDHCNRDPGRMGPLRDGEHTFALSIPDDCPCSFSGKFGFIKYKLKCIGQQSAQGFHSFKPVDVTVIAKAVPKWDNHNFYLRPMMEKRKLSSFLFSGEIELQTNQSCYQPGEPIQFTLTVKNGSAKNIRELSLQLQQTVTYNMDPFNQMEKILMAEIAFGPSVASNSSQTWGSILNTSLDLQPSLTEFNASSVFLFKYSLIVTLRMAGSLTPNVTEEFAISIGHTLEDSLPKSTRINYVPTLQRSRSPLLGLGLDRISRGRRLSMISLASLAPSLPDYDAAVKGSRSGLPSYSSLDINLEGQQ